MLILSAKKLTLCCRTLACGNKKICDVMKNLGLTQTFPILEYGDPSQVQCYDILCVVREV